MAVHARALDLVGCDRDDSDVCGRLLGEPHRSWGKRPQRHLIAKSAKHAKKAAASKPVVFICALSLRTLRPLRLFAITNSQNGIAARFSCSKQGPCGYNSRVRRDLSNEIIGAAISVHRKLGPGLLESAYEACLAYELHRLGRRVERQKPVPVIYDGVKLDCGFRADLVIDSALVVELKCKDVLHPVDDAQLLSHLRLLNISVGLLINFHVVLLKDGIRRMVNNYVEPEKLLVHPEKL